MSRAKKWAVAGTALAAVFSAALPASAGGGYFNGTKGARAAGRGGAFVAKADDLSAVAFNPAGLSHLDGTTLQLGNRFSYNAYSFTRAPTLDWGKVSGGVPPYVVFPEAENQKPWQLLDPQLGAATNFGLKDWMFALVAYAPAGVAREEYPIGGGQRYMMVSREAIILNYSLNAAWKFKELFGVGASFQIIAVPQLKYTLMINGQPFAAAVDPVSSQYDILATTEGKDLFTPNAVIGGWFRPVPSFEIGLSGQVIPAKVETDSKITVDALNPELGDVRLARNFEPANDVKISFPLPMTARLGGRYRHLRGDEELFDIELDLVYETWSRVKRFRVTTNQLMAEIDSPTIQEEIPITDIDIEKHWRDTLTVALGGDYSVVPGLFTARAGFYYESAVANAHYANIDFAGGQWFGGALGGSLFVKGAEIALAYEYRHQPTVSVKESDARVYQETPSNPCTPPYTDPGDCHPRYRGIPAPAVNAGSYDAHSHMASLDVLYRF